MFSKILVPLDRSSLAECVLPHVVAIARAFESQVTLLHVMGSANLASQPGAVNPLDWGIRKREAEAYMHDLALRLQKASQPGAVDPLDWEIRKREAEAYMHDLELRLQKASLPTERHLMEGQAAEQIVEFAHQHHADLILLSSHGQSGPSEWNVGSVVQKIVLRAYTSIMVARAYQPVSPELTDLRYRRLLIPLDGSQRAESVLPQAATLARAHQAQIVLAHVVRGPEMPRRTPPTREDAELANQVIERNRTEAVEYLEQVKSRLPGDVQTRVLVGGHVITMLYELVDQEKIDLVFMSAHGYSGQTRWPYGSIANSFIAYGTTHLLIVQDLSAEEMERAKAKMFVRERKGH